MRVSCELLAPDLLIHKRRKLSEFRDEYVGMTKGPIVVIRILRSLRY